MSHADRSLWVDFMDWIKRADALLPAIPPKELPNTEGEDLWFAVCRLEMSTRDSVSAHLRKHIERGVPDPMSPIEAWFCRRRFEWAAQLALAKVQDGIEPAADLPEVLEWALVTTWESDGCIALWNHAERGGKPHPENPDGLTPI